VTNRRSSAIFTVHLSIVRGMPDQGAIRPGEAA